ncbi:MAG: hypothetical protein RLZZ546_996, partial [Bacteroidota bacterium]
LKNLTRKPEGGYDWKMNYPVLKANYSKILDKVGLESSISQVSTLFIKGENSGYINDLDQHKISSEFPQSHLKTIENAGHWVHADQPQKLLEAIHSFLSK